MAKNHNPSDTVIAEGVSVEGALKSEHSVWVNGDLKGSVAAKDTVTIAAAAKVEADITANNVVIAGQLTGKVKARETVSLHDSGRLEGDIETKQVMVAHGAQLNGKVTTATPPYSKEQRG